MSVIYLLIFLGCVLEGELTILAGIIAVHNDQLSLMPMLVCCMLGGFAGDWFFFELGRRKGDAIKARWPWVRGKLEKITSFLDKYATASVLLLRFQIAMRTVGNIALGHGSIPRRRYLILNLLASILWAIIIPLAALAFVKIMVWVWQSLYP